MRKTVCLIFVLLFFLSGCGEDKQAQNIKVYTPEPSATVMPVITPSDSPTPELTQTPETEQRTEFKTDVPTATSNAENKEVSDAEDKNSGTVYVTKSGKKYHRDGCGSLSKSKIPISKSKAAAQGYTPCLKCFK